MNSRMLVEAAQEVSAETVAAFNETFTDEQKDAAAAAEDARRRASGEFGVNYLITLGNTPSGHAEYEKLAARLKAAGLKGGQQLRLVKRGEYIKGTKTIKAYYLAKRIGKFGNKYLNGSSRPPIHLGGAETHDLPPAHMFMVGVYAKDSYQMNQETGDYSGESLIRAIFPEFAK